jgi:hypothetical protein
MMGGADLLAGRSTYQTPKALLLLRNVPEGFGCRRGGKYS